MDNSSVKHFCQNNNDQNVINANIVANFFFVICLCLSGYPNPKSQIKTL